MRPYFPRDDWKRIATESRGLTFDVTGQHKGRQEGEEWSLEQTETSLRDVLPMGGSGGAFSFQYGDPYGLRQLIAGSGDKKNVMAKTTFLCPPRSRTIDLEWA